MDGVIKIRSFIDRLIDDVKRKESNICVGLDPHPELLPEFLLKEAGETSSKAEAMGRVITRFNREIIDQIADIAAAVKPQLAFYELSGVPGMTALEETVKYAKEKGLIVILDGKKNDIGSTARAYAGAYLEGKSFTGAVKVDALTINPYLGYDGIEPFIEKNDRGAFALVKTSNNSGGDLQDLELADGGKLYQKVGETVSEWGKEVKGEYGYSNLGAVVGATYPEDMGLLRKKMPDTYFLIPGYGAQGGKAEDIISGFNQDGLGALINSSRSIIFAYRKQPGSEKEFGRAARNAALKMRDQINEVIQRGI